MPYIDELFKKIKQEASKSLLSTNVTDSIIKITSEALNQLSTFIKIPAVSNVPGKKYFVFHLNNRISRPINESLFLDEITESEYGLYFDLELEKLSPERAQQVLYTLGIAYCALRDISAVGDKKSPSIFFEKFVGNIFSRVYNTEPTDNISIDLDEFKTILPTDYIFTPTGKHVKIHLPIKLSTRERSVQAWAHQKVLEGIHGVGRFKGVMVVLAETNYQSNTGSVVEVCLPDQWRLYQMYISRMTRIYYLDIPVKYEELIDKFPFIDVKPFSVFFKEKDLLLTNI